MDAGLAVHVECPVFAQSDHRRANTHVQKRLSRQARIFNRFHGNARDPLGLGFIRRDDIAEREHLSGYLSSRRGVQNRPGPAGPGDLQCPVRGIHRLLQLRDENRRSLDQVLPPLDVRRRNRPGNTRTDDDRVVARGLFDKDIGGTRIAVVMLGDGGRHARVLPDGECEIRKRIPAQLGDEMDVPAGARGRHRLVRSLPTGPQRKGIPHDRLAHARRSIRAIGRIGDKDPEYRDMAHDLTPLAGSRPCGT